ncbi:MAG: Calx-beta domain-containing protein, partial [Clostridia bacterium]
LVITPKYSKKSDGNAQIMMTLQESSEGTTISSLSSATIDIIDEDKSGPIEVGFKESDITADGEHAMVEITRKGSPNTMVAVSIYSQNDSAIGGKDFSLVGGLDVYFPMGVMTRTIQVPIMRNSMQEKSFQLKMNMPTGCEITNDTLKVSIAPAKSKREVAALKSASNPCVDTSIDLSKLSNVDLVGGAYRENDEVVLNTSDVAYNKIVGITMPFENLAYYYDGARVTWRQEPKSSWLVSDGYTRMLGKGQELLDTWALNMTTARGFNEKNRDVYFERSYNKSLCIDAVCTGFSGRTTYVSSVYPIKRKFDVKIAPAKPLAYINVPTAESSAYTSAILDNRMDVNVIRKVGGDYVTVTATNSNNFAKLVGLEFLNKGGMPIDWSDEGYTYETQFVKNTSNTNSITFKLTPDIIRRLGERGMETISGDVSGSLIGQITVRPVFEKYRADVKVLENEFGKFTQVNPPNDGVYCIGDRIKLSGVVKDKYKYGYKGVGHRYKTQLNDMMKPQSGTVDTDNFNEIGIQIKNKYNQFSPEVSKNDNTVIVKVKKADVDDGRFDLTRGIFIGSERKENGEYYEYTYVPAGQVKPKIYHMIAYTKLHATVPMWSCGTGNYSGNEYHHNASSEKTGNVILLKYMHTQISSYFGLSGKIYNTDINLSTGRQNEKPTIAAASAIVSIGGAIAVA